MGALLLACALVSGCKDDKPTAPPVVLDPVPDFSLADVNATSATADQAVSPRDYLQRVSAWYFGHST
jgi:hypothetical protein